MRALIYKDFSDSCRAVEIRPGRVRDVLADYDAEKYAVIVNGRRAGGDYTIRKGDTVAVRSIPHATGLLVAGAVIAGVSAIYGGVTAYKAKKAAQKAQEEADKIKEQLSNSGASEGQDPMMPGCSNTVATGKTQPYLIGRRLFTPYLLTDEWDELEGARWVEKSEAGEAFDISLSLKRVSTLSTGEDSDEWIENTSITVTFNKAYSGKYKSSIELKISSAGCPIRKRTITGSRAAGSTETFSVDIPVTWVCIDGQEQTASWTQTQESDGTDGSSDVYTASLSFSKTITNSEAYWDKDNTEWTYRVLQQGFASQQIEKIMADDEVLFDFTASPAESGVYSSSSALFPDTTVEIRQGGEAFQTAEFTYKMSTEESNAELKKNDDDDYEDLVYTLPVNAKSVYIPAEFPSGLFTLTDSGKKADRTVKIYTEYSKDGGESWSKLGTQFGKDGEITLKKSGDWYFVLSHEFTDDEVIAACKSGTPIQIKISCLTDESESNATDTVSIVKVRSRLVDTRKAAAGVISYAPLIDSKVDAKSVKIGLKLKTTQTNSDKASKIQVIACGKARTWDGSRWIGTKSATRNAAAWVLEVLTSDTHVPSRKDDSEIDLASFGDFYDYCEENAIHTDLVLTQGDTKENVLKKLLDASNATLYRSIYGKMAVAIDDVKDNAIAVLNQQNIISFSAEKDMTRVMDGYRVKFTDAGTWKEDSKVFMRDGSEYDDANAELSIEEIEIGSFTADSTKGDYKQVFEHVRRKLNADILRPHSFSIEIGQEGYFFPLYSRIKIQHPALCVGLGSSTIKRVIEDGEGNITGLELYSPVAWDSEDRYGAVIQCVSKDYSSIIAKEYIAAKDGAYNYTVTFTRPVDKGAAVKPCAGNILSYGTLGDDGSFASVTTEMTVTGVSPSANGYKLTGVDYSAELFDYGAVPVYKSNLTEHKGALPARTITREDIESIAQTEAAGAARELQAKTEGDLLINEKPDVPSVTATAGRDSIRITCSVDGGKMNNSIKKFTIVIYKGASDTTGTTVTTEGAEYTYSFSRSSDGYPEADALGGWKVKAKATNFYGMSSEFSNAAAVGTSNYGTWSVQAPEISARVSGRNVTLTFSQPARSDGKEVYGTLRHQVQIKKTSETSLFKPAVSLDPYASEDNYKSGSGYVTSGEIYQQVMPLEGQNAKDTAGNALPSPVDTSYTFSVKAYNEAGASGASAVTVIALATSAYDIVNAAITENKIAVNAVTENKIADSSVVTSKIKNAAIAEAKIAASAVSNAKIAASAVTEAKIAAGAVTADKIAANAVVAEKIAAGAVTAEKLSVGTGANLYDCGYDTFDNITAGSLYFSTGGGISSVGVVSLTTLAGCGHQCLEITAKSGNTGSYVYLGSSSTRYGCIPVKAGQKYIISAWMRASAKTSADIFCLQHTGIDSKTPTLYHVNIASKNDVGTSWVRVWGRYTGKSDYPYISLRFDNNSSATTLWVAGVQIEEGTSKQEPSPFSPAGVTVINGGNILTGTVSADRIVSGSITSTQIKAGGISTASIAAGAVDAGKISVENLAALSSNLGDVTAGKIQSGAGESPDSFWDLSTGEFRIGNNISLETNSSDDATYLHFKPKEGLFAQFKQFILKTLGTIISGKFFVKKSGAKDADSFLIVNPTDTADTETSTAAKTLSVKGNVKMSEALSVTGTSTFAGKTTHNAGIGTTTLEASGAATLKSALSVTGTLTASGAASFPNAVPTIKGTPAVRGSLSGTTLNLYTN